MKSITEHDLICGEIAEWMPQYEEDYPISSFIFPWTGMMLTISRILRRQALLPGTGTVALPVCIIFSRAAVRWSLPADPRSSRRRGAVW